ncbi:hypothetical protein TRFO_17801 [Tritrichomonas foetus]|uniref:Initiator binding domain-containing protein n=1 Tax=Tritrichomonas foetus TaxID=1144522 RepID=A0A1J4KRH9_9EUKA|nr:hypothetical protein TRFO_17801 [Tritrichomonas foetus]|eukprot:OHT12420.1 hypothetical protein TRFO_17801 [Tritrichomonas foetus]
MNLCSLTEYDILKIQLKNIRNNEGRDYFKKQLETIREFIEKIPNLKEQREMECGIAFIDDCICVQIHNLKNTLNQCKSSVNNSFQYLGYISIRSRTQSNHYLFSALPTLKIMGTSKQWSVRTRSNEGLKSNIANITHFQTITNYITAQNALPLPNNEIIFYDHHKNLNKAKHMYENPQISFKLECDQPMTPLESIENETITSPEENLSQNTDFYEVLDNLITDPPDDYYKQI